MSRKHSNRKNTDTKLSRQTPCDGLTQSDCRLLIRKLTVSMSKGIDALQDNPNAYGAGHLRMELKRQMRQYDSVVETLNEIHRERTGHGTVVAADWDRVKERYEEVVD